MTYDHIETFLSVVAHGTISSAANHIHVSQSTVSTRIQQLEEELGAPLLLRRKGVRTIELTPYGTAFISIASQWASLWKDTQNLKTLSNIQTLTIASVDAINSYTFVPLFNRLIERYPNVRLFINTHHSDEIHGLVESRMADVGFVFSRTNYPDIVSRPVFRELMYLICHKDSPYHNEMPCEELRPEEEVYLRWGQDFQEWHDLHWYPERYSLITVNTGSMLQHYLDRPGRWAVAPMSVVHAVSHKTDLTYYTLREPPTPRICYMLTNRYPNERRRAFIQVFEQELETFIAGSGDICSFESWMLKE